MRVSKGIFRCLPICEYRQGGLGRKTEWDGTYEFVDEEILLLFGIVSEEDEDEVEGLSADVKEWVQGKNLHILRELLIWTPLKETYLEDLED